MGTHRGKGIEQGRRQIELAYTTARGRLEASLDGWSLRVCLGKESGEGEVASRKLPFARCPFFFSLAVRYVLVRFSFLYAEFMAS